MTLRFNILLTGLIFNAIYSFAQQESQGSSEGVFNAYLSSQANVFIRDSNIGASGTPQYDRQLFGSETWLDARYSNWGLDFGLRLDLYQNSNLINPQASFNRQGIGRWFIKKEYSTLGFEAGYIYDQVGSGIIYRAYEQRNLGIDNALYGIKLRYQWNDYWHIRAFAGKQKIQFEEYESLIKGMALEGYLHGGDSSSWSWAPGIGFTNRTLDDGSMNNLLSTLSTYQAADQFLPKYNTYAFTLFNTLRWGDLNLFVESALKSKDVMNDPNGQRKNSMGQIIIGPKFIHKMGQVFYGSLNYSKPGWGLSVEGKRTRFFGYRTRPQEELNNGLIQFIPPMSRQNSYRLTSFYQPATQELGEQAIQAELQLSPASNWNLTLHHSRINALEAKKLYREFLIESTWRKPDQFTLIAGIQHQHYNQQVFEGKPLAPLVKTWIPYIDWTRQFNDITAIRFNLEYMHNKQDMGSWTSLLIEYSLAPKWVFTVSDMYNIKPIQGRKNNYYTAGVVYSRDVTRVGFNLVRQRAGIVCTGGICRYEPAFNGIKFNLESRF